MARAPRLKSPNSIFHIMVRSISEIDLFKDDFDKNRYLKYIKHYQQIYNFKVYAYCLMTNHGHLLIDANGADISKIMHCLNSKYVRNFNKRYDRHGHLFQDRFKSKIIDSHRYLTMVSAYIHNNPVDISKFKNCPEKYTFSSLGVYLGIKKDTYNILDEDFIMQFLGSNVVKARKNYRKFVRKCSNKSMLKDYTFLDNVDNKTVYKSERKIIVRNFSPSDVLDFVSKKTGIHKTNLYIKNNKNTTAFRALASLLMRSLCNFKCKDICKTMGNISQARVSSLCTIGVTIINKDKRFNNLFNSFIEEYGLYAQ